MVVVMFFTLKYKYFYYFVNIFIIFEFCIFCFCSGFGLSGSLNGTCTHMRGYTCIMFSMLKVWAFGSPLLENSFDFIGYVAWITKYIYNSETSALLSNLFLLNCFSLFFFSSPVVFFLLIIFFMCCIFFFACTCIFFGANQSFLDPSDFFPVYADLFQALSQYSCMFAQSNSVCSTVQCSYCSVESYLPNGPRRFTLIILSGAHACHYDSGISKQI